MVRGGWGSRPTRHLLPPTPALVVPVVVAVMTLVMIFTALFVVLECMEGAADVVLYLLLAGAARRRHARIDHGAVGRQEPLTDIDSDGCILGRLIDHQRRIELHFQLGPHTRGEHEGCPLERAFNANAL